MNIKRAILTSKRIKLLATFRAVGRNDWSWLRRPCFLGQAYRRSSARLKTAVQTSFSLVLVLRFRSNKTKGSDKHLPLFYWSE